MVHEQKFIEVQQVIDHALSVIQSYTDLKQLPIRKAREYFDWKPPPSGSLKLNVDGAVFDDLHKAGVGVVLRDDAGMVIMATSKVEFEVINAKAIESLAIFRALQLCATMGIHSLIVESDCLMAIQVLNNDIPSDPMLDPLLCEIRKLLRVFVECKFQHIYRESNRVAHILARYAWNVENISMWNDCYPDFISQVIWLDKCL
ncbi:hypothetical protein F2P56_034002 [Juglans regia]|uniref:RNase H type-1 domain-containing protein n=2 Tax=Juglans regia TaxID=51240 RepID=A0A833X7H7_JUGRE|nr:uncharacterized protein LOC108990365 [Juglans regia]KAF5444910.1 hypothetical protein F2P56_034002 [Juglans regia]